MMPDTLYHEAVPGHHFQVGIAQDLNLPPFQRDVFFSVPAFGGDTEGWGLYAERLAWEMGVYADDPYGNLGPLLFDNSI